MRSLAELLHPDDAGACSSATSVARADPRNAARTEARCRGAPSQRRGSPPRSALVLLTRPPVRRRYGCRGGPGSAAGRRRPTERRPEGLELTLAFHGRVRETIAWARPLLARRR